MAKRTVTGDVVETECTVTLMPVLGDSAPLGATLQTYEVADALTSGRPEDAVVIGVEAGLDLHAAEGSGWRRPARRWSRPTAVPVVAVVAVAALAHVGGRGDLGRVERAVVVGVDTRLDLGAAVGAVGARGFGGGVHQRHVAGGPPGALRALVTLSPRVTRAGCEPDDEGESEPESMQSHGNNLTQWLARAACKVHTTRVDTQI
jgi:hypothetical protein